MELVWRGPCLSDLQCTGYGISESQQCTSWSLSEDAHASLSDLSRDTAAHLTYYMGGKLVKAVQLLHASCSLGCLPSWGGAPQAGAF